MTLVYWHVQGIPGTSRRAAQGTPDLRAVGMEGPKSSEK